MNVFWCIPSERNLTSNVFTILHRIIGTFSTFWPFYPKFFYYYIPYWRVCRSFRMWL